MAAGGGRGARAVAREALLVLTCALPLQALAPGAAAQRAPSPEAFIAQAAPAAVGGQDALVTVRGPGPRYDDAVAAFLDAFPDRIAAAALQQALLGPQAGNLALVTQIGAGNLGLIDQDGMGNTAAVHHDGLGNVVFATQAGDLNILGLWIRGDDNHVDVLQLGDDNQYFLSFEGDELRHHVRQVGEGHRLVQHGRGTRPLSIQQSGSPMEIRIEHHPPE